MANASRRADEARSKLNEIQTARKKTEAEGKQAQEDLEKTENAVEHKNFEDMVRYYKNRIQEFSEQEQQQQTKQIEAEDQLQLEQSKLDSLMARLDELEKSLQLRAQ